ncbi:hypothetical protein M0804_013401 [Polistes exclamans]|nr:hypothetical protein M0804_013401 [Polistes exclamans]
MSRNQYEEETVENYAYDLQKIYDKCNYTDRRNERLCEQFQSGIRDDTIRIQLKNVSCLSFDNMIAIAIALAREINCWQEE